MLKRPASTATPVPGTIGGVRCAWSLLGAAERRGLRLVALFGVAIAALDTLALLLVYDLIALLGNEPLHGLAAATVERLGLDGADRYRSALVLLTMTAFLFIARSLLSVLALWLTAGAANAAQEELVSRLAVGHARAPQLVRLERSPAATLRTILISVDQVVFGVVASSVSLVSNCAVACAVALGLFLSSPLVALAVTAYFAVIAFAWARGVRGALARRGARVQRLQEQRYRLVLQGLSAAKELQLRGRSLFYADRTVSDTRSINEATRGAVVANGALRYLLETSLVVGAVLVVAVAGVTSGRASVLPAVGLVLAGAFRLLPALNQILFLTNQVQYNTAAIDVVEAELETFGVYATTRPGAAPRFAQPHRLLREIRLNGVTFRYPARRTPAVRRVDLVIGAGESIGILGPTGSGKSTLLDLILGTLEPEQGRVMIDGRPLSRVRDAWQRSIGYVPQDVYLVDDTLEANVTLGWDGEEVDRGRLLEAIRLAGLDDVVAGLPEGLETVVGERGVKLSGGQRQRVGLARALYVEPSVLVLDEATSNLDHATERRIVETLAALRGELTIVMVTHRVRSVAHCDRVVYLEKGAVRACGSFDTVTAAVAAVDRPMPVRTLAVG
jgi:ABC-type multidrug transport system fused ATPase/permease subunit